MSELANDGGPLDIPEADRPVGATGEEVAGKCGGVSERRHRPGAGVQFLDRLRRRRDRIDRRVERMFAEGLVDETRRAAEGPGGIGPTASQAAGYSEALGVLAGTLPISDAIRLTQARTRQLAKRQLTWLRSFSGAVWIAA
jgi:hypothetical protein